MLKTDSTVYIAGHNGMVGSAIVRRLRADGFKNIITQNRKQLDLCNQQQVKDFFSENTIDYVVLAAAKVGGIYANNTYPADFIYQNLMIEANVIHSAYKTGIQGLLFLGSSCIYPKYANQPMTESELLTSSLEPTNEPYAIAKIAGIKLCESYNRQYGTKYRSVMPTNLYGENDNFHPQNSHVIPALMRRIHGARIAKSESVSIWGTGNARREFLHVDDLAAACMHIMQVSEDTIDHYTEPMLSHINVGVGVDITIKALAELLKEIIGFEGVLKFDSSKPDGTKRKLLDASRINQLGWKSTISLRKGLEKTYEWFVENEGMFRV